jgi:hypothetical protein
MRLRSSVQTALALIAAAICVAQGNAPLRLEKEIPLPDVKGRICGTFAGGYARGIFVSYKRSTKSKFSLRDESKCCPENEFCLQRQG